MTQNIFILANNLYICKQTYQKIQNKEDEMKKVLLVIALPMCLVMGQDQPELPGWGVYGGIVMASASGDSIDGVEAVNLPAFGVSRG